MWSIFLKRGMHPSRFLFAALACVCCLMQSSQTASAQDQSICIVPVFNDPSKMLPIEIKQPYRLISSNATGVLDEYPGLIINPTNRNGIYTVTGREYRKVPPEIAAQIGKWGAGKREDEPIFTTEGMSPGFTFNDMYPEFFPVLGLYLMRSKNSVWFRKSEHDAWKKFTGVRWFGGFDAVDMGGSWEKPKVLKNPSTGLVAMSFNKKLILFGQQSGIGTDLTYKYHAFRAGNFVEPIQHKVSGTILFWGKYGALYRADVEQAKLADTPWPNPSVRPVASGRKGKFEVQRSFWAQTDPETGNVLFRHPGGVARFDGDTIIDIEAWSIDRLSKFTTLVWVDGVRYAKNSFGLFSVDTDLNLNEIESPLRLDSPEYHLFSEYSHSTEFDLIFIVNPRADQVFTTKDFSGFREVTNNTGTKITQFVSDVPGETSSLLVGTDGLYAAEYCGQ